MYTFNVGDLLNELLLDETKGINLDFKVHIMTHDDMEYEVTRIYLNKEEKKIYLRGDQRFDEDWWKF